MFINKRFCIILYCLAWSFISCNQNKTICPKIEASTVNSAPSGQHSYGGWFCPDNLNGFPPIDIKNIQNIPVIKDRLPTKEETQNGLSLIHIDTVMFPSAKVLDINLPRIAKINSAHDDMKELIIVIQAVVIDQDTILGYRFPNGGNGSDWFAKVDFLSKKEVDNLPSSPFVYLTADIKSTKAKIWEAFGTTKYAKDLAIKFKKDALFDTPWDNKTNVPLNSVENKIKSKGLIADFWGNIYLHIDYNNNGFHFSEKLLVSEDLENNTAKLHIVAGPYPEDFLVQKAKWKNCLKNIKQLCE